MNVKDIEELGLTKPPVVEPSLANHLNPSASSLTGTFLPGKTDRFSASINEKVCVAATCSVWMLDVMSLLLVYQADLMLEMHNLLAICNSNKDLWDESCVVTDFNLRASRGWPCYEPCSGGEGSLLAQLSNLSDKEKADFLDAPVESKELFGPAVAKVEAFNFCLRRRPRNCVYPAYPSMDQGLAAGRVQFAGTRGFPRKALSDAAGTDPTVQLPKQGPTGENGPVLQPHRGPAHLIPCGKVMAPELWIRPLWQSGAANRSPCVLPRHNGGEAQNYAPRTLPFVQRPILICSLSKKTEGIHSTPECPLCHGSPASSISRGRKTLSVTTKSCPHFPVWQHCPFQ